MEGVDGGSTPAGPVSSEAGVAHVGSGQSVGTSSSERPLSALLAQNPRPSPQVGAKNESQLVFEVAQFLATRKSSRRKTHQSKGARLQCSRCSVLFRYKSTLSYHLQSECGTKIIVGRELVARDGPGAAVVCDVCGKRLCSRTSLMVHMRIHTGERPFSCHHCGKSFYQKAHLRDHVRSLHTPGQFICRACNAMFPERLALDEHLKVHFPPNYYQCQHCGREYHRKSSLSNHISTVHLNIPSKRSAEVSSSGGGERKAKKKGKTGRASKKVREGPFTCPECQVLVRSSGQLRRHLRLHRAPSNCPHCPRTFSSSYDLRMHMRSHTGERPFKCGFCSKGFARKSTLETHKTLHTGQKDFACKHCDKAYNRKTKLDTHVLSQHMNSVWVCVECQKSFKCKSYLDHHVKRTHGAETRYPCQKCPRRFKTPEGLKRHRRPWGECSRGAAPAVEVLSRPSPTPSDGSEDRGGR